MEDSSFKFANVKTQHITLPGLIAYCLKENKPSIDLNVEELVTGCLTTSVFCAINDCTAGRINGYG